MTRTAANRLYSHFNRQRLDAEEIRDCMLFVAGDLDSERDLGPIDGLSRRTTCAARSSAK